MTNFILGFVIFLISLTVFAHDESFLPKNNLSIPVHAINSGEVTEEFFNSIQEELKAIYVPMAAEQGGKLTFKGEWKSSTVNAYAQRFGKENEDGEEEGPFNDWRVIFLGGLARHKHVTKDGFTLIVCHELGHHFGGAPTYDGETAWASNEGQADTFSVSKCLRRLWEKADNGKAIAQKKIPEIVLNKCSENWKTETEKNLCLRIGLAAESIGNLFGSLVTFGKLPKFETPDLKVVSSTLFTHPKAQCRLDTFFQASLCQVPFDVEFSRQDETIGACHPRHGDVVGNRPLCWFAPKL